MVLHHNLASAFVLLLMLARTSLAMMILEPGITLEVNQYKIVLFEVSPYGAGGLVYNQPSPLRLKDINIPRFHAAFGENRLMMGRDLAEDDSNGIAIGEIGPSFWFHNVPELAETSTRLEGAQDELYMGGNIDQASKLVKSGVIPASRFKFFHLKYKQWVPLETLHEQLEQGQVIYLGPATAAEVLES